jgi:hypothetical protein
MGNIAVNWYDHPATRKKNYFYVSILGYIFFFSRYLMI